MMHRLRLVALTTLASAAAVSVPAAAWAKPKPIVKDPDPSKVAKTAPGATALVELINTMALYALIASLIGLLLSGLILAIGPRLGFHRASEVGKVGIIASFGVAFLVGVSAGLINYFYAAGAK